ncbi:DUF6158 family protein [Georgenia sp. AZ-5]|uniref:DUF6158 family protein n=1 Tax=Georgenia sp. AZ-5 TaxID=3367526 RepID=UPI003754C26E
MERNGVPAGELSDEELERQGARAHATRNWVFLHGTAQQYQAHTDRMLELEQEYLRRHPKRTWQGTAPGPSEVDDLTRLRTAMKGMLRQMEELLSEFSAVVTASAGTSDEEATLALLRRIAEAPGGRMHKLEAHQVAREVGLDRTALAQLYTAEPPLLATQQQDRVITEAGRALVEAAGVRR